jgi:hypothetical protein
VAVALAFLGPLLQTRPQRKGRLFGRLASWEARLAALRADPLLQDVPADATVAEVRALVAQETGQGLRLVLVRYDGVHVGPCARPRCRPGPHAPPRNA